jgi:hypothetical protein
MLGMVVTLQPCTFSASKPISSGDRRLTFLLRSQPRGTLQTADRTAAWDADQNLGSRIRGSRQWGLLCCHLDAARIVARPREGASSPLSDQPARTTKDRHPTSIQPTRKEQPGRPPDEHHSRLARRRFISPNAPFPPPASTERRSVVTAPQNALNRSPSPHEALRAPITLPRPEHPRAFSRAPGSGHVSRG